MLCIHVRDSLCMVLNIFLSSRFRLRVVPNFSQIERVEISARRVFSREDISTRFARARPLDLRKIRDYS